MGIEALGIGPGDEVILPAFTIISCIGQIIRSGENSVAVNSCIQRINILGSGDSLIQSPSDEQELIRWWQGAN